MLLSLNLIKPNSCVLLHTIVVGLCCTSSLVAHDSRRLILGLFGPIWSSIGSEIGPILVQYWIQAITKIGPRLALSWFNLWDPRLALFRANLGSQRLTRDWPYLGPILDQSWIQDWPEIGPICVFKIGPMLVTDIVPILGQYWPIFDVLAGPRLHFQALKMKVEMTIR